jgi:hypothetical protein
MEKLSFTRTSLSNVKAIMMVMRVHVVEWLCQAVMRRILILECLLSGARGCL